VVESSLDPIVSEAGDETGTVYVHVAYVCLRPRGICIYALHMKAKAAVVIGPYDLPK
jgi:hypothetical protein